MPSPEMNSYIDAMGSSPDAPAANSVAPTIAHSVTAAVSSLNIHDPQDTDANPHEIGCFGD